MTTESTPLLDALEKLGCTIERVWELADGTPVGPIACVTESQLAALVAKVMAEKDAEIQELQEALWLFLNEHPDVCVIKEEGGPVAVAKNILAGIENLKQQLEKALALLARYKPLLLNMGYVGTASDIARELQSVREVLASQKEQT